MPNLFLISGNDEFSIRQKAGALIEQLCGNPPEENPCLDIFHGDSTEKKLHDILNDLIMSIYTPAFFGGAKTIWLKRFDFSQIPKSIASKNAGTELVNALKAGLPEDVTLVLDGQLIDKRSALFKICQKTGEVNMFERVDIKSRDWEQNIRIKIMKTCQENNIRITAEAATFLSETSGTGTGRILSELQKLFAYIAPRDQITIEDCQAICSFTPEAAGWAFADALAERNLVKSLNVLNILFNNKIFGLAVLYSIIGRFQDMISIKVAAKNLSLSKGVPYPRFKNAIENIHPELKEKLKESMILKSHPYRAWIMFSQSANFADAKLADSLSAILNVNRQLVSGGCDPRIALELLASQVCK